MNEIEQTRTWRGYTRDEVCDRLGIPYRTLQNWECGQRTPAKWVSDLIINEIKRWDVKIMPPEGVKGGKISETKKTK